MSFWQSLKPDPKNLRSDAVSGFATGLFSIPEGMAYAQLAGVNQAYSTPHTLKTRGLRRHPPSPTFPGAGMVQFYSQGRGKDV